MTGGNTEFNDIPLNDSNRTENRKTKTFGRENLEELQKISEFHKRKFTEFEFK